MKSKFTLHILKLCVFIVVLLVILCGCEYLPLDAIGGVRDFLDTPQTQVELPGGSGNLIQDAIDDVFGTDDDHRQNPTKTPAPTQTETPVQTPEPTPEVSDTYNSGDGYLRVDYVDVGQADFIVIECDGEYMTIDGGNVADSQLVYSYLDGRDISHLEYVVVTHAHEDHCGGVSAILSCCTADVIFSPVTAYDTKAFSNVVKKAGERGLSLTVPKAGDTFTLGGAEIQVLGPVKSYSEPNNTSIVLKLTYGNTSFLFTGDAEEDAEKDMIDAGYDLTADVLKAGHHGSYTSSSYVFLREVMPFYVVIQSNREDAPEYDHPHDVVLSRYRDLGATVYRNDLQGTITCYSDGTTITFEVEQNPNADTLYELVE